MPLSTSLAAKKEKKMEMIREGRTDEESKSTPEVGQSSSGMTTSGGSGGDDDDGSDARPAHGDDEKRQAPPTSSEEDNNAGVEWYESTTDSLSERRLARSFGYPRSWHVVRRAPHPADIGDGDDGDASIPADRKSTAHYNKHIGQTKQSQVSFGRTAQDHIYSGDPRENADCYYNHVAASSAALKWVDEDEYAPTAAVTTTTKAADGSKATASKHSPASRKKKSTPYDDNGGQMLPRMPLYQEGRKDVEVYYEPDNMWYPASILKIREYEDDIRYTVHYTEDDSTQANVREELIRWSKTSTKTPQDRNPPPEHDKEDEGEEEEEDDDDEEKEDNDDEEKEDDEEGEEEDDRPSDDDQDQNKSSSKSQEIGEGRIDGKKSKPKASNPPPFKKNAAVPKKPTTGTKAPKGKDSRPASSKRKRDKDDDPSIRPHKQGRSEHVSSVPIPAKFNSPDATKLASDFGLPSGWMAVDKKGSRYEFLSPDGRHKFHSKRAVFSRLGMEIPIVGSTTASKKGPKRPKPSSQSSSFAIPPMEDDDPSWRLTGHAFLNRRVKYNIYSASPSELDDEDLFQTGTVTGWISKTDVDRAGNPGFISESTGKPASLFHVVFGQSLSLVPATMRHLLLQSQDFEDLN